MSAIRLAEDLRYRGIVLSVAGGRLRADAPRGALTEADRDRIRALKPELLALLTENRGATAPAEPRSAPTAGADTPPDPSIAYDAQGSPVDLRRFSPDRYQHVTCASCMHWTPGGCGAGLVASDPQAPRLCGRWAEHGEHQLPDRAPIEGELLSRLKPLEQIRDEAQAALDAARRGEEGGA